MINVFEQQKQQVEQTHSEQLSQLQQQQQQAKKSLRSQARQQISNLESQKQQVLAEVYKQEELNRRQQAIGGVYTPLTETKRGIESKAAGLQETMQIGFEKSLKDVEEQVKEVQVSLSKWKQESLASVEEVEATWRASNVELDSGEWVPKEDFEVLPADYQAKLTKLGVDKFNDAIKAEQEQFEVEFEAANVEIKPNVWVDKSRWEALTSEQQQEAIETGTYTVVLSPREQFDTMRLKGELPTGAYYVGPVSNDPTAGFTYNIFKPGWGKYLGSPNQFIPEGITAEELAAITGLSVEEVKAKLAERNRKRTEGASTAPEVTESELSKLPPAFVSVATAATGALFFPEPLSSAAGGITYAVLAAIAIYATARGIIEADIDWSKAFEELRDKFADAFTVEKHAGSDVPTTKIEAHPEAGTIEITPAQTTIGGQVQTFILEQSQIADIITTVPLKQIGIKDIITTLPLEQQGLADIMTTLPLEQAKLAEIMTTFPLSQQSLADTMTTVPLMQQKLEDTILKSVAVATAAHSAVSSIPSLQGVLTAAEISSLSTIKEHYLSAMRDIVRSPDVSTREELYTHMSNTRVAIHQLLDQLLEEGRIDRTQYKLFLEQLRVGERSEKELLEWLEQYFLSTREMQDLLEGSAPHNASFEIKSSLAATMLSLLTQLRGLPKSEPGDTVSEYTASSIIVPQITEVTIPAVTEIASPITITATPITKVDILAATETTISTLTDVATQAATQAAAEALAQGLTIPQTMAAVKAAAQTAARTAVAQMIATRTMSKTAINTAVRTAVDEAEATATRTKRRGALSEEKKRPKLKAPPIVPDGTWAWKQGFGWRWYPPPYDAKKPYFSFYPPAGAKNVHLQTPEETIQIIGDPTNVPDQVGIDLGVVDILLLKSPKPTITFKGEGLVTVVGTRIPSTTQGLGVPARWEDKLPRLPEVRLPSPKLETIRLPAGPFEVEAPTKTISQGEGESKESPPGLAEIK